MSTEIMTPESAVTTPVVPTYAAPKGVVTLTKSGLIADKEAGLTNPEMATKYGLSTLQISKAMDMAGLRKKKAKAKPRFIVTED